MAGSGLTMMRLKWSQLIKSGLGLGQLLPSTGPRLTIRCTMGGDGRGNFIFPDFHCAVDGMMALAKILEFLATQKASLGDVVSKLPPYHMAERKVSCVLWGK